MWIKRPARSTLWFEEGKYDSSNLTGSGLITSTSYPWARNWITENQAGRPNFYARRRREADSELEVVGKRLRAMMPWMQK